MEAQKMYDFDVLMAEVLRNKPEIDKDSLMALVEEKKRTVGSGYLTDQGALFLIAGELGVRLQHLVTSDLTLKDLHVGANDITVVARVLAIYPVSEFKKKDGSGVGRYRRVNLFDQNQVGRLTIWEDNEEGMRMSGIGIESPVRVASAYVKPGLDGKPNLNLGKRGKIEVIEDAALVSRLPSLSSIAKSPEQIQEGGLAASVRGVVVSDSRRSTFVRRDDGSAGSLTQFELKGPDGRPTRVVVWDGTDLPEVKAGSEVIVTNLRRRKGRQGEEELHGDGGTMVMAIAAEGDARPASPFVKVAEVPKYVSTPVVSVEVMALSKGNIHEVSLKDGSIARKGEVVLGDETGEITMVGWDEASETVAEILVGEKLRVRDATIRTSRMGVETLELKRSSKIERL